jgi:hypothetical protein
MKDVNQEVTSIFAFSKQGSLLLTLSSLKLSK